MLDKKKKYSESKSNLYFMMPKLLILFKNKKKIPWNPCIHTMKQKSYYLIFSNQLFHDWHEVVQIISVGTLIHMGWGGQGRLNKLTLIYTNKSSKVKHSV